MSLVSTYLLLLLCVVFLLVILWRYRRCLNKRQGSNHRFQWRKGPMDMVEVLSRFDVHVEIYAVDD